MPQLSIISSAHAQTATKAAGGFDFMSLAPIVGLFAIFYFLLIRPQQKKAKIHREMLTNLRRGDRVITAGGIIGTISQVVSDDELEIEIANNVTVRIVRGTVSQVLDKPVPVKAEKPVKKAANKK